MEASGTRAGGPGFRLRADQLRADYPRALTLISVKSGSLMKCCA